MRGRGDRRPPGGRSEVDPADPVMVQVHGPGPRAVVGDIDGQSLLLGGDDRAQALLVLDPDRDGGLVTGRHTVRGERGPVGAAAVLRLPQHGRGIAADEASVAGGVGATDRVRRAHPPPTAAEQSMDGDVDGGGRGAVRGAAVGREDPRDPLRGSPAGTRHAGDPVCRVVGGLRAALAGLGAVVTLAVDPVAPHPGAVGVRGPADPETQLRPRGCGRGLRRCRGPCRDRRRREPRQPVLWRDEVACSCGTSALLS